MTYHRDKKLICHYCGYEIPYINQCPNCHSQHIAPFGLGTEKVESALNQLFPQARVIRMDADTTRRKNAHTEMLETFSRGEADILLGTQMIVKGHDYENVTLVGILAADLSLHNSDYRCAERTFQLLCQAAGRAGRGRKKGEVVIQTYSPDHYAISAAAEQSYENFYKEEIEFRKLMLYPPCGHLLVTLIQSSDEKEVVLAQQRIVKMISQSQDGEKMPVQILNPGQSGIGKIKDIYRRVIYLKHEDSNNLIQIRERLSAVLEHHPMFARITVQFDLDPMSFY